MAYHVAIEKEKEIKIKREIVVKKKRRTLHFEGKKKPIGLETIHARNAGSISINNVKAHFSHKIIHISAYLKIGWPHNFIDVVLSYDRDFSFTGCQTVLVVCLFINSKYILSLHFIDFKVKC